MKNLKNLKNVLFVAVLLGMLVVLAPAAQAVDAVWDHSDTPSVFKYKLYWGTVSGVYPNSMEIQKSACAPGVLPADKGGGAYDCKVTATGTFAEGTTYYFAADAWNYAPDGSLQPSAKTTEVPYIKRPAAQTGPKPSPQKNLGVYDSVP